MDYKKILEGVVNIINTTEKSDIGFANICTYIGENCHELKESEDERIRKALIEMVHDTTCDSLWVDYNVHKEDALAWLEKQGEQKPADKVEPKFKVGDWITNGATKPAQISSIEDDMYYTHNGTIGGDIESMDKDYHLWTIADAKDGDVLASELCDSIILFRGIKDDNIDFYCDYDFSEINVPGDRFAVNDGQHYGNVEDSKDFHPATKEQRDTLGKAMADAGYAFDFEKKGLKKLKFRVGDEVKTENEEYLTITRIDEEGYWSNDLFICGFDEECIWDLVEQKPAWSEEDEVILKEALRMIESPGSIFKGEILTKKVDDWLKSIKGRVQPQPKQEWSEEEEKCIRLSTDIIDSALRAGFCVQLDRDRCVDWLKSLRPQNTWKPTTEQLTELRCVISGCSFETSILVELEEDLKKLL